MRKQKVVTIIAIVIFGLAAFKTVIPTEEATKVCLLGYKAFCAFTPVSTLILAASAAVIFLITRNTILKESA